MYRKNVAGQNIAFVLIDAATGEAMTGATVSAFRSIDGGAQASATGSVTEKANGQYNLALSQADTNGNHIGVLLTATDAVPVHFSLVTTADDPTTASPVAPTAADIATAVWAYTIETGWSAVQSVRVMLASLAGKVSGASSTTITIRDAGDSKDRIVAAVDQFGNRTSITYDKT